MLSPSNFLIATLIYSNISVMINTQVTRHVQYPHLPHPISHVDTHNGTVVKPFCPRTLAYYIYINARSHHSICVKLYSSLNMNIWYVCERQPHSVTPQKFTSMNKLLTKHRRFSTSTHPTEPHDILFPRTSWNSFKDLTPTSHVYTGATWRTVTT